MNILYLHTHDTGRYIEPYGYQVSTPNLMELAQDSFLFRQAFSAAPTCSPSRAGLLTGSSPHSVGMNGLAHRGFELKDYDQHLVRFLNQNDFETVLCGIQHEAPDKEKIGYQKILDRDKPEFLGIDQDLENAEKVADYIKQKDKAKDDTPFFLSLGLFNTHREFAELDEDIDPDYVQPPFPVPDCPETREEMAKFQTSLKKVDQAVGRVLTALKETELEEETIIIFTTDHGLAFPEMKCTLYDTGIGVSLLLKDPNKLGGEAIDSLVSQKDIFPTLCDMLDLEKPDWLEGNSMLPLLEDKQEKIRDEIFGEVTFHAAYEPMRCIRTERYKLIRFYGEHSDIIPANIDDGLTKDFLLDHDYLDQDRPEEQLFDLYHDPVEKVNLVNDERYQEVYEELSKRLENWMEETGDPLLKGYAEKPEGAVVNKRSCISPEEEDFE